jgi:hypothetical protein
VKVTKSHNKTNLPEETYSVTFNPATGIAEGPATVGKELLLRVSDSEAWGPGNFEKVFYAVEVKTTLSLGCQQTAKGVTEANRVLEAFVGETSEDFLEASLEAHRLNIRDNLYRGYFHED